MRGESVLARPSLMAKCLGERLLVQLYLFFPIPFDK